MEKKKDREQEILNEIYRQRYRERNKYERYKRPEIWQGPSGDCKRELGEIKREREFL